MGVSAAAAIALAPLCIPPAPAHAADPCASITDTAFHQACIDIDPCAIITDPAAHQACMGDDPCAGITDPAAHQACIADFRWWYERRACEASPRHGQIGQVCG
jgi:hypothetical protein